MMWAAAMYSTAVHNEQGVSPIWGGLCVRAGQDVTGLFDQLSEKRSVCRHGDVCVRM